MASKGRKRRQPRPWQQPGTGERPPPDPGMLRRRECGTKVAHANRIAAEQAALEHEHLHGEAKAVYECRFCGRWHVGSPR